MHHQSEEAAYVFEDGQVDHVDEVGILPGEAGDARLESGAVLARRRRASPEAVVQDDQDGTVLMVAWMDAEAVRRTLTTGRTWFWSRSRQEYWRKGDTSGHVQHVRSVTVDCDVLVVGAGEGAAAADELDRVRPGCRSGPRRPLVQKRIGRSVGGELGQRPLVEGEGLLVVVLHVEADIAARSFAGASIVEVDDVHGRTTVARGASGHIVSLKHVAKSATVGAGVVIDPPSQVRSGPTIVWDRA